MFQVEEAIRSIDFENLPGRGKPLNLEVNPFEDSAQWLANHILKENGFTPLWIEKRKEIESELNAARKTLQQAWTEHKGTSSQKTAQDGWEKAASAFKSQILRINQKILSYNLQVPSIYFQRMPHNAEREILKLTASSPSDKL